jgi:enoyl-CoA hydratase/carnithine racemase
MSSEVASDVILEEVDDHGVCVLTLNRPDTMNSMNGELVNAMAQTFYALDARDDVRVVVLTGAGDKAFCAGADLKERRDMSDAEVTQRLRDYRTTFRAIEQTGKPVICAINGYAFGGGLEIALACDLRLMAQETKIGLTETRLGIIPGAGGTQRLPRIVGVAKAKELIFTAKRLDADEALSIGLVNRVCPRESLLVEARVLGREIAQAAPIALAQAKTAIQRGVEVDLETGLEIEAQCYAVTIPTQDRMEGLEAFAEKREPEWKGR